MNQAVAYCRVSGTSQVEGDGWARQEQAINKVAADKGLEVVEIFRDEAISGTVDSMNRPAWVKMLEYMQRNDVSCIIIEKLDRLARDLMISEYIIKDLQTRKYDLISAYEPDLCSSDPTRKLMRQIMAAFAEYDKMTLVTRMRAARERVKARTGKCEGAKPYGFYANEKAPLIEMSRLKNSGLSWQGIAICMNEKGIKTRFGRNWSERMVYNVVTAAKNVMITEAAAKNTFGEKMLQGMKDLKGYAIGNTSVGGLEENICSLDTPANTCGGSEFVDRFTALAMEHMGTLSPREQDELVQRCKAVSCPDCNPKGSG